MASQQDLIKELKEKQKQRSERADKKGFSSQDFKEQLSQASRKYNQRAEERQKPSSQFKKELEEAAAKKSNKEVSIPKKEKTESKFQQELSQAVKKRDERVQSNPQITNPAVQKAVENSMAKKPVQGRRYTPQADARNAAQQNNPYQGGLVQYGKQPKSGIFKSTNDSIAAVPRYTNQQQGVANSVNNYLQNGQFQQNNPGGGLNLPGNNINSFEPIRNAAYNTFNQKTGPTIAERFQSLGGRDAEPGALSSGALRNQLWNAENDFRLQLAGQEAQYNLANQGQQANNYFNLLQTGLAPQYDTNTIPGQNSAARNVAMGALNAGLGYATGGLSGAASGIANYVNGQPQNYQQQPAPIQQAPTQQQPTQNQPLSMPNSLNPYQTQNSIAQGYMNNLSPQGGMNRSLNQNSLDPSQVVNSTVRGFGNRIY